MRALLVAAALAASSADVERGNINVAAPVYNTSGGPLPGKINIHLFAHSHDDVGECAALRTTHEAAAWLHGAGFTDSSAATLSLAGWLKSPQEYYDGAQVLGLEPWPELSVCACSAHNCTHERGAAHAARACARP